MYHPYFGHACNINASKSRFIEINARILVKTIIGVVGRLQVECKPYIGNLEEKAFAGSSNGDLRGSIFIEVQTDLTDASVDIAECINIGYLPSSSTRHEEVKGVETTAQRHSIFIVTQSLSLSALLYSSGWHHRQVMEVGPPSHTGICTDSKNMNLSGSLLLTLTLREEDIWFDLEATKISDSEDRAMHEVWNYIFETIRPSFTPPPFPGIQQFARDRDVVYDIFSGAKPVHQPSEHGRVNVINYVFIDSDATVHHREVHEGDHLNLNNISGDTHYSGFNAGATVAGNINNNFVPFLSSGSTEPSDWSEHSAYVPFYIHSRLTARYKAELKNLQAVGFNNITENILALATENGNVQSAIDLIVKNGGGN